MTFRARVTKCSITNVDLDDCTWNKDRMPSLTTNAYANERCLLRKTVPKLGRYKVALYADAHAPSKGFAETIIVWNGKIVSREKA